MQKQTLTETPTINQRGLLGASYVCCFWGKQEELNRFLQSYAVEKTKIESRRQGHSVTEQTLEDGSIKLTVHVGGEG